MNLISTELRNWELRNWLGAEHLEVCMRLSTRSLNFKDYPRECALELWYAAKQRLGEHM